MGDMHPLPVPRNSHQTATVDLKKVKDLGEGKINFAVNLLSRHVYEPRRQVGKKGLKAELVFQSTPFPVPVRETGKDIDGHPKSAHPLIGIIDLFPEHGI
jgi:hypothetical protein